MPGIPPLCYKSSPRCGETEALPGRETVRLPTRTWPFPGRFKPTCGTTSRAFTRHCPGICTLCAKTHTLVRGASTGHHGSAWLLGSREGAEGLAFAHAFLLPTTLMGFLSFTTSQSTALSFAGHNLQSSRTPARQHLAAPSQEHELAQGAGQAAARPRTLSPPIKLSATRPTNSASNNSPPLPQSQHSTACRQHKTEKSPVFRKPVPALPRDLPLCRAKAPC